MRKDYKKTSADIQLSDKFGKETRKVSSSKADTKLDKGLRSRTPDRANSIEWYANNPELVRDSASFPTNDR